MSANDCIDCLYMSCRPTKAHFPTSNLEAGAEFFYLVVVSLRQAVLVDSGVPNWGTASREAALRFSAVELTYSYVPLGRPSQYVGTEMLFGGTRHLRMLNTCPLPLLLSMMAFTALSSSPPARPLLLWTTLSGLPLSLSLPLPPPRSAEHSGRPPQIGGNVRTNEMPVDSVNLTNAEPRMWCHRYTCHTKRNPGARPLLHSGGRGTLGTASAGHATDTWAVASRPCAETTAVAADVRR